MCRFCRMETGKNEQYFEEESCLSGSGFEELTCEYNSLIRSELKVDILRLFLSSIPVPREVFGNQSSPKLNLSDQEVLPAVSLIQGIKQKYKDFV